MIPGQPPNECREVQKKPLWIFLIQDGRHHGTPFFSQTGVYPDSSLSSHSNDFGVFTYVVWHKDFIQMIRYDFSPFLIPQFQDGRHIKYVEQSLKKKKYAVTVEPKNVFLRGFELISITNILILRLST